jgi:autotransporter adhesin
MIPAAQDIMARMMNAFVANNNDADGEAQHRIHFTVARNAAPKRRARFVGNWLVGTTEESRGLRRRLMACLRLAHRVLGLKRDRLALGVLGRGAIAALILGAFAFATPAQAQPFTLNGGGDASGIGVAEVCGSQGMAIGQSALAGGCAPIALGTNAIAAVGNGGNGIAIGASALANGVSGNPIAVGVNATASAPGAAAFGESAKAFNNGGVAVGQGATASAQFGTAVGADALAQQNGSVAIGSSGSNGSVFQGANAKAANSIAIGAATTNVLGDVAIGYQSQATGANGTGSAVAIGLQSNATGQGAVAVGSNAQATGTGTTAMGQSALASGTGTAAFGLSNTASGTGTVAIGQGNTAAGTGSIAVGNGNTVIGTGSVALGNGSAAGINGGIGGFAAGDGATAKVSGGVALGSAAVANNAGDVALGSASVSAAANPVATIPVAGGGTKPVAGTAPTSVVSVGAPGSERQITNVAAGRVSLTSTDAVNGSELYQVIQSVASAGTGPFVSDNTAAAAAPVASGKNSAAGGFGASATGSASTVVGNSATDNGNANATVLGNGASITAGTAGSNVALGQGSAVTAAAVATPSATIAGTTYTFAGGTPGGVVSVGTTAAPRQVTNVAAGQVSATSLDAVNGSQLFATNSAVNTINTTLTSITTGGAGIKYFHANSTLGDSTPTGTNSVAIGPVSIAGSTNGVSIGNGATASANVGDVALGSGSTTAAVVPTTTVTVGGVTTTVAGTTPASTVSVGAVGAERTITNVAAGRVSATSTDAINGSELNATNTQVNTVTTTVNNLTNTVNNLTNGKAGPFVSDNTASAANPLATGVNSSAGGFGAAANGLNSTVVGNSAKDNGNANATVIGNGASINANTPGSNVALGQGSTVAAGAVPVASGVIGGTTYNFAGGTPSGVLSVGSAASPRQVTNVAAGQLSATSLDAVNGSQLFATNSEVNTLATALTGGGGIKYFHANSTLADSTATGTNSVAIGPVSTAGTPNAVSIGNGATASAASGDVALGAGATTSIIHSGTFAEYGATAAGSTSGANGVVSVGAAGSERQIQNVAPGVISATSTDAINGSQLNSVVTGVNNIGTSVASALGGGSTYNSTTGTLTPPSYTIGGTTYNNVGGALNALTGGGTTAGIKYFHANSTGTDSTATGTDSVAIGSGAVSSNKNDVALGAGSTTAAANPVSSIMIAGVNQAVAGTNPTSVVSVGGVGTERQITNVAAGRVSSTSTDAINGSELFAVQQEVNKLATSGGGGSGVVQYSNAATPTTPNGGTATQDATLVGATAGTPVALHNVAGGSTAAGSTDAINGGQLNTGLSSVATALGGGSTYNPATGQITSPTYTVGGTTYNNVGAALTALTGGGTTAGIKYFHANSTGTDSNPIGTDSVAIGTSAVANNKNDVALGANSITAAPHSGTFAEFGGTAAATAPASVVSVGAAGSERQVQNVGAGVISSTSTDAINGSQLFTVVTGVNNLGNSIASALGGNTTYNSSTGTINPSFTFGGNTYTSIQNLVTAVAGGASNKYFQVNSTLAGASATGTDATASGPLALASGNGSAAYGKGATAAGDGSLAMGESANASQAGGVAIGQNSKASGTLTTVIGAGASATGANSVALGAGSTDGGQSNVVSVGAPGAERRITNVAAGTNPTDAVNVSQFNAANANTQGQINNVQGQVSNLQGQVSSLQGQVNNLASTLSNSVNKLSGGIAAASALGGAVLPDPGTSYIGVSGAEYNGQGGLGFSLVHHVNGSGLVLSAGVGLGTGGTPPVVRAAAGWVF